MIDNRESLCEHGGLHPIIAIKGKYIPGKVYNIMKETATTTTSITDATATPVPTTIATAHQDAADHTPYQTVRLKK